MPVRIRNYRNQGFRDLILSVQESAIEAENYHYCSLAKIQSNSILKQNLFDHIMVFENYPLAEHIKEMGESRNRRDNGHSFQLKNLDVFEQTNYNLNIIVAPSPEMSIMFNYNGNVYTKEIIEGLSNKFDILLNQIIKNDNVLIGDMSILSADEQRQLLYEFNDTRVGYPKDKTIHQLFEEQVEKTPDNTAVVYDDQKISYKVLNEQANLLGRVLRKQGVKSNAIVGIIVERSLEMIIGIYGILKSGGAYLPIDINYPPRRIDYIIEDSNADIVLTMDYRFRNKKLRLQVTNLRIETVYFGEKSNLDMINHSTDIAYTIYTSGTTGNPKGVIIQHDSLMNTLLALQDKYPVEEPDVYLLKTSYVFDVSLAEIFGWCLGNGRILILEKDGEKDPNKLLSSIQKHEVTHINFVPTMFNAFLMALNPGDEWRLSRVKYFFLAGEALTLEILKKYRKLTLKSRLENIYGPTEASIYGSWYSLSNRIGTDNVPIGKPLYNVKMYIINKYHLLCPLGVVGELSISGKGLARGYINDKELTSDRFIGSRFIKGERIYLTGDLARWLPDGHIEFLGRIDDQVKIRGFRIELGEIEAQLLKSHRIKEAVVMAKEDKSGNKYLCAYFVLKKSERQKNRNTEGIYTPEIRRELSHNLPDYMIPAYFVELDSIPLTGSGKVDRGALPEPVVVTGESYTAPGSEIEMRLVEVWQQVLGLKRIGINDNFFMLGGDSIKTIQIVSRMRNLGYGVEMRDIFDNPTISKLAPFVKKTKQVADQSVIEGKVPLIPIQSRFFNIDEKDIHHYNQSVLLYKKEGFDPAVIRTIFTKLQEHHDALRMVYKIKEDDVVQVCRGIDHPLYLKIYDFRQETDALGKLIEEAAKIQESMDLENGPLMRLGLFRLKDGDRLLIAIHHLVIDGVSWRILFEDIETLYNQYEKGEDLKLLLKSDSFKTWSEKLMEYSNSKKFLKEKEYWKRLESVEIPVIKRDFNGTNYNKDSRTLSFMLGKEETSRLLMDVNRALNSDINDILITGMGLGLKKSFGMVNVLIELEGHGREEVIEGMDINRTVGWFTTLYPVILDMSYGDNRLRQVKEVKETLHQIPHKGIGYGILRYLTLDEKKPGLNFNLTPQICFNYLGQFDTDIKEKRFKIAKEYTGNVESSNRKRDYEFNISGMISNKRLRISVSYSKNQYKSEAIKLFLGNFKKELIELINYCSGLKARVLTPSDLTYTGIPIDILDRLSEQYSIEDIYRLSPMQEGMLFHSLYDNEKSAYFEQRSYWLRGKMDIKMVKKSLDE
jgi:amino acid adenylation domain-containing protein/non-ribosomal peptide synthase protein (TIGR01720 family)